MTLNHVEVAENPCKCTRVIQILPLVATTECNSDSVCPTALQCWFKQLGGEEDW